MDAEALVQDFTSRGIKLIPNGSKLTIQPASRLTDEDRAAIRAHKPELLDLLAGQASTDTMLARILAGSSDPADEALAIVARLKTFTLPAGRMPAARAIAERLRPLLAVPELDPAEALAALKTTEAELTALGGAYDQELAEAIGLVHGAFPSAPLIQVQ